MNTNYMLDRIQDWTKADAVAIVIWNDHGIEMFQSIGMPETWRGCGPEIVDQCACGAVRDGAQRFLNTYLTPGKSFHVGNAISHRRLPKGCFCREQGYESVVLVPLRAGGGVVGVIQLCARAPYAWEDKDVRRFEALSAALGIASRSHGKGNCE